MSLPDELVKLAELHRSGALTDAEYAAAKSRLIDGPVQAPPPQASKPVAALLDPAPTAVAASQTASETPPKWMRPWGWFLVWIGGLGFFASAYINWKPDREEAALIAGLFNPMFFVSMPIGLYWLFRSRAVGPVRSEEHEKNLREIEARVFQTTLASETSKLAHGIFYLTMIAMIIAFIAQIARTLAK
jgi:hypothetical protein